MLRGRLTRVLTYFEIMRLFKQLSVALLKPVVQFVGISVVVTVGCGETCSKHVYVHGAQKPSRHANERSTTNSPNQKITSFLWKALLVNIIKEQCVFSCPLPCKLHKNLFFSVSDHKHVNNI